MAEEEHVVSESTLKSIMSEFMFSYNNRSQSQFTNLVSSLEAFMNCFSGYSNLKEEVKTIVTFPIKYFVERNPDFFSKEQLRFLDDEFSLPELEFLYFRDTSFASNLRKRYPSSGRTKKRYSKQFNLPQMLNVLQFIKRSIKNYFIKIAVENNIDVPPPLFIADVKQHELQGVGVSAAGQQQRTSNFQ